MKISGTGIAMAIIILAVLISHVKMIFSAVITPENERLRWLPLWKNLKTRYRWRGYLAPVVIHKLSIRLGDFLHTPQDYIDFHEKRKTVIKGGFQLFVDNMHYT